MVRVTVFFDIDNTLYSYEKTGFHHEMHDKITQVFADFLKLDEAAAMAQANEYYHRYGLALCGLARHHHSAEHPVPLKEFCRVVNACSYDRLERDEPLAAMIARIQATGLGTWLLTNADHPHATECIAKIGLTDLFADGKGGLRCIDCVDQWGSSDFQHLTNKPMAAAYHLAVKTVYGDAAVDPAVDKFVMIDDAIANLEVPTEMGWVTVWISHGRPLPAGTFKPTFVIPTIHELESAIAPLVAAVQAAQANGQA